MSIETDLRKDGIEVLQKLDTLHINSIAKNVAESLVNGLPELNLNYNELFMKLSRLDMYLAKIPTGMAEANYCYVNSSIYFNHMADFSKVNTFAVHECIHYLQELRNNKNVVTGLGLYNFATGLALNEAAVQLMTSKAVGEPEDEVKYYDITLKTTSPNYYPLLCNLVKQMTYVTGDYALYTSAFYGTNSFKEKFCNLCGEKNYHRILKLLDRLLNAEEEIITLTNTLQNMELKNSSNKKIMASIEKQKKYIRNTYFEIQNLILVSYFDTLYKQLYTLEDIESYRSRLYHYKDYIGTTNEYFFFNDYYLSKMEKLEAKKEALQGSASLTSLVAVKESKLSTFFRTIKNLFRKSKNNMEYGTKKE